MKLHWRFWCNPVVLGDQCISIHLLPVLMVWRTAEWEGVPAHGGVLAQWLVWNARVVLIAKAKG